MLFRSAGIPRTEEVIGPVSVKCHNGGTKVVSIGIDKAALVARTEAHLPLFEEYSLAAARAFTGAIPDPYTVEIPKGIGEVEEYYNLYAALVALKREKDRYKSIYLRELKSIAHIDSSFDMMLEILSFYLGSRHMEPAERLTVIIERLASLPMVIRWAVHSQVAKQVKIACQAMHYKIDLAKPGPSKDFIAAQTAYLTEVNECLEKLQSFLVGCFQIYTNLITPLERGSHPLVCEFYELMQN